MMHLIKRYTAPALVIFYIVGSVGILLPIHPQFILLTPLNMLFSVTMMLLHHPRWDRRLGWSLAGCYMAGWLIELIGVQTGLLFGEYQYGATLGLKLWDTPLLIGLNWAMLVYIAAAFTHRYCPQMPLWIKAAIGATMMVALDCWIEPVAIRYDFWSWNDAGVNGFLVAPFQNYLFWWVAAFALLLGFHAIVPPFRNQIALLLYLLQIGFFMLLYGLS